jgi:hypothetical protein
MLIKGQEQYACIFDVSRVLLRLRSGETGRTWIDAVMDGQAIAVAEYASRERATAVLDDILAKSTTYPPDTPSGARYALPEE